MRLQSTSEVEEDHDVEYRVVHQPAVRVRSAPSTDARVVAVVRAGKRVRALRKVGEWVQTDAGWLLTNGDSLGLGQLLAPTVVDCSGRSAATLEQTETELRKMRRHPALELILHEHTLRGLPLVASDDACALLGVGKGGIGVVPYKIRSLRGAESALAAVEKLPCPPPDYEPAPEGYKPPTAYEPGECVLDLDAILKPKEYQVPERPPLPLPTELSHLYKLCKRSSASQSEIDAVGLTEDSLLCISGGGGRFDAPPKRCAMLSRRRVILELLVRAAMTQMHREHLDYISKLDQLCAQMPQMQKYVEKRWVVCNTPFPVASMPSSKSIFVAPFWQGRHAFGFHGE